MLGGERHQDAAARGAVELGHHQPGDARDAGELGGLRQRVLPDGRVEHQQHGVRRARVDLLHHAHDLLQFGHQLGLVLQAAGGVDDQHVCRSASRRGEGLERKARGIRALLARDDGCAGAAAPDLELIDRGGAERVAGGEHHVAALGAEACRELADRGGLAGAIHADDEDHERLRAVRRSSLASRQARAPSRLPTRGSPSPPCRSPACRSGLRRSPPRCAPRRPRRDRRG